MRDRRPVVIGDGDQDHAVGHEEETDPATGGEDSTTVEDVGPTLGGRHWATTLARSLRCARVGIIQITTDAQRVMACRIAISKICTLSP